jgi:cytochrome P450
MAALQASMASFERLLPGWMPTPARRELRLSKLAIDEIVGSLVAARRAKPEAARPDLLGTLLAARDESGDGLTEREVRDHLVTLFLAGHETTSHALTWSLVLLAQNPDKAEALRAEVDRVLQGRPITHADVARLVYAEQVLNEAMRLYPPVYSIVRKAVEDTEIMGYRVPRGSEVIVWTYLAHRDPRWYENPETFVPERFAPDRLAQIPKYAYVPFGAGPRVCIGKAFAMLEARIALATIVQRAELELIPRDGRVEAMPRVTLVPRRGARMRVRRRTR